MLNDRELLVRRAGRPQAASRLLFELEQVPHLRETDTFLACLPDAVRIAIAGATAASRRSSRRRAVPSRRTGTPAKTRRA